MCMLKRDRETLTERTGSDEHKAITVFFKFLSCEVVF